MKEFGFVDCKGTFQFRWNLAEECNCVIIQLILTVGEVFFCPQVSLPFPSGESAVTLQWPTCLYAGMCHLI